MISEIRESPETIRTFELAEPTGATERTWRTVKAELRMDDNGEAYAELRLFDPEGYGFSGEIYVGFGSRHDDDGNEIDDGPRVEALMTAAMAFLRAAAPAQREGDGDA